MMRLSVLVVVAAVLLDGCGRKGEKDESLAKKAGAKVGETLTEFASGVGTGVDTKMLVPVELSQALLDKGVSKTVAKSLGIDRGRRGFSVYLIAKDKLSGSLLAKAFNNTGDEIGRSKAEVSFEADDAKYVSFTFDSEMDSALVAKYVIDLGR